MDIVLNVEYPEYSGKPACILVIEPDRLGVFPKGDMAWLTTQAHIKRGPHWDQGNASFYPLLIDLQGVICSENMHPPTGMPLYAPQEMPIPLMNANDERLVTLAFPFPLSFVQQLEQERSMRQGQQDMRLKARFWGTVFLVNTNTGTGVSSVLRVATESNHPTIRIAGSDWLDRFLVPMGYPARRYIALPTMANNQSEETQQAAAHLAEAWDLFRQERYREAVQRCRQANDALLDPNKTTWAQTTLAPLVGAEKAAMIDAGLRALGKVWNDASHGANAVEIDREAAEYVIGSMTLILNYIDRKAK